jgi:hypothetical protein
MNKKSLRKSASFAPPLLSAVPNAVKIGAGVGGGLGLLQGAGIFESDAEKKATNVGNRLGKVLTSSTVGAGLGAGAGYGVNRYKGHLARNQELEELAAWQRANPKVVGVSVKPVKDAVDSVGNAVTSTKEAIRKTVAPTTEEQIATMRAEQASAANPQTKPSLLGWIKNKAEEGVQQRKNLLGFNKMIRKSANFQDPATIQRLIQYGSTYIPQPTDGVVSLESTLKGKMQKRKAKYPQTNTNMTVGEINKMIASGTPTGKYFNKTIRKSANFLKRQQQAEFGIGDQINSALTSAGKFITQPAAKVVRKAATKIPAGDRFLGGIPIIGSRLNGGAKRAAAGTYDALQGAAKVLDTDKAAKLTAIGVGGTALAGGGLLAAKAMQKDEARYSKNIRKSASFGIIPTNLIQGAQKAAAGTAKRFASNSPQINAANVGTAVGAGLGALEGSGINETEEQRRSTGLVGRAGKVLGMTGLGAGVGRGVGSAVGYGIDKYQTSQKWNARNKARAAKGMPSSTDVPTRINVQDQDE